MKSNLTPQSVKSAIIRSLPQTLIALPIKEGYELVKEDSILYCKAAGNYTEIYFLDGQKLLISRKLKVTSTNLSSDWFMRIHQSYLVNLQYAQQYLRKGGGQLVMLNGAVLPVSKNQKEQMLKLFNYV